MHPVLPTQRTTNRLYLRVRPLNFQHQHGLHTPLWSGAGVLKPCAPSTPCHAQVGTCTRYILRGSQYSLLLKPRLRVANATWRGATRRCKLSGRLSSTWGAGYSTQTRLVLSGAAMAVKASRRAPGVHMAGGSPRCLPARPARRALLSLAASPAFVAQASSWLAVDW